jgi:hypothetical protein
MSRVTPGEPVTKVIAEVRPIATVRFARKNE